jgi:hypothetical protein
MEQTNEKRNRIIGLRLTMSEYGLIEKQWKKSNCRKLSDYVRRLIFSRPLVSSYRNRSMDEAMAELMLLRKELNAIGVNFNQAVHRLHTLDHLPQMLSWLTAFERDKSVLFGKMDEVALSVEKMAALWLQ